MPPLNLSGGDVAALLEIEGLTKRFGTFTAVDGVSFDVSKGEVLGFLGPNGAGKTTTMRMLAGFITPTAGRARICRYDVQEQGVQARRNLGSLPEGASSPRCAATRAASGPSAWPAPYD
jgi:ABC-2 type transport system ATP-binding protein